VDALLGGEASASSVADVRASGQVERVDSGFRLLLSMGVGSTTPSSRVIEARTCDELAGAAAIAIALLARSTLSGASGSGSGETTSASAPTDRPDRSPPPPAPPPAPAIDTDTKERTTEARPAGVHFVIDAPIGGAGWGLLPSTGLELGAGLGIRWNALRVIVRGDLWQPQTDRVSGFDTRFTLQSGRAEACLTQEWHGLELGPCVGVGVQRISVSGVSSTIFSGQTRTAVWASGAAGLFASLPTPGFAHLRFFGEATALISPIRPRFVIDHLGPVSEPSLAAPQVDLGCEWIF